MTCRLFSAILFAILTASVLADPEPATYPEWWESQGVVSSENAQPPAPTNPDYEAWMQANYAPANLGQAKNMANAAYLEMESKGREAREVKWHPWWLIFHRIPGLIMPR